MSGQDSVRFEALPSALVDREQWVCWREEDRDGKATKVPVNPHSGSYASSTDPDTWGSLAEALERDDVDGVGIVFWEEGPLAGVDLDDCRDPETGQPTDEALEIVNQLDSYTEVSPSGTGYHVLLRGEVPEGGNRSGGVEMYDEARFFTMTGEHVEGTPSAICERDTALAAVHREYIASTSMADGPSAGSKSAREVVLSDSELLERARAAENGEKFERLWRGNTTGYESQSEADMALCCQLAFWTGNDAGQMDRLFRESGLLREKWDEVHFSDGSTYGEKTIERAIANTSDLYDPSGNRDGCGRYERESGQSGDRVENEQVEALRRRVNAAETTIEHLESTIASLEEEVSSLTEELAAERRRREELEADVIAGESGGLSERLSGAFSRDPE